MRNNVEGGKRLGMLALDAIHSGHPVEAMRHLAGMFAEPGKLADSLFLDGFRDIDEWAKAARDINISDVPMEDPYVPETPPPRPEMKIMVNTMRDHLHLLGEVRLSQGCKERIVACIDSANAILKKRCEDEDCKKEARRIEQESVRSMAHRKTVAKYEKRRR